MLKLFLFVSFMIFLGVVILGAFSPEYVSAYVFFIFSLIVFAVVLKIALDFYLANTEEEEEKGVKTFYDIDAYRKELKKQNKHKSR